MRSRFRRSAAGAALVASALSVFFWPVPEASSVSLRAAPTPSPEERDRAGPAAVEPAPFSSRVAIVSRPNPTPWWPNLTRRTTAVVEILAFGSLVGGLLLEHRRRHQAEANARSCLAKMAHLDRRAAMGQLTASLTHELHQPLGAILRNSEAATMLLASGSSDLGEVQEIVEDIRKDVRRAAEIIRRTRMLLQSHELSEETIDLNDVVRDIVEFVAPDAASLNVRLEIDLQAKPVVVTGDRVHLQQVLLNLVLNGLDAMTRTAPECRRMIVTTAARHGHADVTVQDTGSGIPADSMKEIFEPFFTTKAGGMGMGLSIARSVIEAHHGRILAENNAERGATVRFSLPLRRRDRNLARGGQHEPHAA